MNTIEAKRILEQALAGQAQDDWQVYRAKRSYLIRDGVAWLVLAILTLGGLAILLTWFYSQPVLVDEMGPFWSVIIGCPVFMVLIIGLICVSQVVARFGSLRSVDQQSLVITADGFVAREGLRDKDFFQMGFGKLESISMKTDSNNHSIRLEMTLKPIIRNTTVQRRTWSVDQRFGDPASVSLAIIAAQARYAAEHPVVATSGAQVL